MADSDRSRSPVPMRNRLDPRGQVPAQPLPFFPLRCGPMSASVRHFQNMPRLQNRPNWSANSSGLTSWNVCGHHHHISTVSTNSTNHSATTYVAISTTTMSIHAIVPTYPTVSTNTTVPTWPPPSISPSQPRSTATPKSSPTSRTGNNDANRTHGFDPNAHRQENRDHYDNQKINGLTLPRSIRQSALTHRLGIEGCDPLSLPVIALMYQHTNNHWLRKLAHGREIYLIPTVDIAAVVFTTEPLTQLRNRGIDLDRVSHFRARQDGKVLDKTANTKYAAQQIAEQIQSWLPARTTGPDSQHEITQLRNQLVELRQRAGEDIGDTATPPRPGQSSTSLAATPIQRALTNNPNNPAPPSFEPACLLTIPTTTNPWLADHMPSTLAVRAFTKWLKNLPISDAKHTVLTTNIAKTETWWARQPAETLETIERVAVMMGIPVSLLGKNYEFFNLLRAITAAISMTN